MKHSSIHGFTRQSFFLRSVAIGKEKHSAKRLDKDRHLAKIVCTESRILGKAWHSAKIVVCDGCLSLPSVHRLALDKEFYLINSLPSVLVLALGKEIFFLIKSLSSALALDKEILLINFLPSVLFLALGKDFFNFLIKSLPSAWVRALGKKKILCRVPWWSHSANIFQKINSLSSFAKCLQQGIRQRKYFF